MKKIRVNSPAVILGVVVLLGIGAVFSSVNILVAVYNTMVSSKMGAEQALSDLESVYQRRYALVENLVGLVKETKGFEQYQIEIEKELYPRVAEAKAQATKLNLTFPKESAQRMGQETTLHNVLLQTLDKLLVMAQHYPTITDPVLKDRTATFEALAGLKTSLQDLEVSVQTHRQNFNASVRSYNQNIRIFPANLFAASWGFAPLSGFEVLSDAAREDVRIAW